MDSGTKLRDARRQRGLSLHDIAEATKIPATVLESIERNDFARVPGGLFTRAYLRAFARHVGLDPEEIVREYLASQPHVEEPPFSRPVHEFDDELRQGRVWLVALVAACLVYILYASFRPAQPALDSPSAIPQPVAALPASPGVAEPLERTELVARSETAPVDGRGLRLDILPHGLCWVEATADDRRVLYRLMQPGERHTVTARETIVLRVGDPGAFGYRLNGEPGVPLGRPGRTVTVQITRDNYRSFVFVDGPTDVDLGEGRL